MAHEVTREAGAGRLSVLHVVPYFPPDRVGGVGEVAAHVHAALLEKRHRSRVLTTGSSHDDENVVRVVPSPGGFVLASPFQVALTRNADVVHVHHGEVLGLLVAMKLARVPTPILLTLHASPRGIRRSLGSFQVNGRRMGPETGFLRRTVGMRIRYAMDRGAMALADRLSFISRSTARDFLSPEEAGDATVIYNGLPELVERSARPDPDPVELLYVGVYSVRKRVQVLPFVLARIRDTLPHVRMRLIGFEPEDHPDFLELARSLGVEDSLVFEGVLSSRELPPYYRAARVLLVPSAYEGLPMVVMEAFQNRLPCVATRVSGLPEIVEPGLNGYLVELDKPAEMARAAVKILEDPTLEERMGTAGRAMVQERFGVERQVEEYLELYRELRTGSTP